MKRLTLKQQARRNRMWYRLAMLVGLLDCAGTGYLAWTYEFGSGYGLHPAFFFATLFVVVVALRIPAAWIAADDDLL